MWLKRLKIKNVQSHEHTVFKFSPRVNAITGISHSGKTAALFRSLKLLILNRPLGLGLKSDFSKETDPMVVSLETTCGNTVTLTKSKKDAKYVVTKGSNKPRTFRKFSKSPVPDAVKEALGVDFDLSFQDQLFPYSIFGSSTDLGKRIDNIVGAEKLEKWISKTSNMLFTKKRELKKLKKTLLKISLKLKKYKGLRKLKKEILRINSLKVNLNKFDEVLLDLESINTEYLEIKSGINRLNGYSKLLSIIDRIIKEKRKSEGLVDLLIIFTEYKKTFLKVSNLKKEIPSLKMQYVKCIVSKKRCPLCFSEIDKKRIETTIRNTII